MQTETDYGAFLGALKAVADPLRADILRLLARDSFGVLELAHMLDVSQPALSHHLKILATAGLVTTRRDGNSIYYRRCTVDEQIPAAMCRTATFDALDSFPLNSRLRARRDEVHRERAARSQAFFRANARAFEEQRALICHPDIYLPALTDMIPDCGRCAIDVGPGDGEALPILSTRFERVLGVDNSKEMLDRAQRRIANDGLDNVTLREAEFTAVKRPRADFVLMAMVLHHAASPMEFLAHTTELLASGGRLVVVELVKHAQAWAREACGDLWLGFEPEEITDFARHAGFAVRDPQFLAQRNGFRIQLHAFDLIQGAHT
jgi:ArsR family transcriptional regulator